MQCWNAPGNVCVKAIVVTRSLFGSHVDHHTLFGPGVVWNKTKLCRARITALMTMMIVIMAMMLAMVVVVKTATPMWILMINGVGDYVYGYGCGNDDDIDDDVGDDCGGNGVDAGDDAENSKQDDGNDEDKKKKMMITQQRRKKMTTIEISRQPVEDEWW